MLTVVCSGISNSAGIRFSIFFFFNDTATTEIYTLSLHDALPIFSYRYGIWKGSGILADSYPVRKDRKSTRLNSSHGYISYAVFCLKKKNTTNSFFLSTKKTIKKITQKQQIKQQ